MMRHYPFAFSYMETSDSGALLAAAVRALKGRVHPSPRVGIVLGSGLGGFAERFSDPDPVPYGEVPGLPSASVAGHAGQLVFGRCGGLPVVAMQGRLHLYEGHSLDEVVFGVRLMRQLQVETLVVTNAAGGVDPSLPAGALMAIGDHLNLTGMNCLVGPNDRSLGERFPDMSEAYDAELRGLAHEVAKDQGLSLHEGVYAGVLGPSYETPAEIRMLQTLGASAVGMSTVQEVIAARHAGLRVLGISCITNPAAGLGDELLSHADVQEAAQRASGDMQRLVEGVLERLAAGGDAEA